jgi:hypothetical protein
MFLFSENNLKSTFSNNDIKEENSEEKKLGENMIKSNTVGSSFIYVSNNIKNVVTQNRLNNKVYHTNNFKNDSILNSSEKFRKETLKTRDSYKGKSENSRRQKKLYFIKDANYKKLGNYTNNIVCKSIKPKLKNKSISKSTNAILKKKVKKSDVL